MTIAVTGATGQLGRLVLARLQALAPHTALRALVRDPAKAADLGVEVHAADYNQPQALAAALRGVDTLLLISSSEVGQRTAQHRNVIDAARGAGVRHVVYTSVLHADTSPLALAAEHRATEALLRASGLQCTLLRNGWYTENYTASLSAALAGGVLIGAAGEGRIASATRADFAEAAAVVLGTPGHEGKTYELAGDQAYTLAELAAEVARQTGKPFAYRNLAQPDYAAALAQFGLPPAFAELIASSDVDASHGALFDDSHTLSGLIGRPTTGLAHAVAAALPR
ncbi:MAG: SDR family oxidoreductase [Rhodoferax sp.]